MLRAVLPRFLLLIALLFVQLGGLTHAITHSMNDHGKEATLAQDEHCDLCQLYAQLDGAVGTTTVQFDPVKLSNEFVAFPFPQAPSLSFRAYTARAPPGFA